MYQHALSYYCATSYRRAVGDFLVALLARAVCDCAEHELGLVLTQDQRDVLLAEYETLIRSPQRKSPAARQRKPRQQQPRQQQKSATQKRTRATN
ncbi:MAG: hypothetical protein KatS3mg059_1789 [Thermomicrobiales bacterium]|nr:MAG: hypothetical protein KatS3mg059_1777 [Thermomicrobiales bacterium]GIW05169.1 MAG: hypothetical protein KatS3mg059_1789 [Thermomicrobiales bacterium]